MRATGRVLGRHRGIVHYTVRPAARARHRRPARAALRRGDRRRGAHGARRPEAECSPVRAARLVETNRIGPLPHGGPRREGAIAGPSRCRWRSTARSATARRRRSASRRSNTASLRGRRRVLYHGERVVGGGWIDATEAAGVSFLRGRPGQVPLAALLLLLAFLALPFIFFFGKDMRAESDLAFDPARFALRWRVPPRRSRSASDDRHDDRRNRTRKRDGGTASSSGGDVGPGHERFLAGPPRGAGCRPFRARSAARGCFSTRMPTASCPARPKGHPRYEGRIVLENGCLRLQRDGETDPGPLVMGHHAVFRDAQGYLSIGLMDGREEYALRVGEPNARLRGVVCSKDTPMTAPSALERLCGVDRIVRLGEIKREAICSPERIADLERQAGEYRIANAAMREAAGALHGRERFAARPARPRQLPAPYSLQEFDCRMPAAVQARIEAAMQPAGHSSQPSSTQP